jgi:hypothetical protein
MRYGNQNSVPGAPGNLAGGFPPPIIPATDPRAFPMAPGGRPFGGGSTPPPANGSYPMGNNQNGRDIVEETRQRQFPTFIPPTPGSSNVAGAVGNMGGMAMKPIGGSIPFTPAQEQQFQNWLQNTNEGKRLQNLRERLNQQKGQASVPGAPGNLGVMLDANQLNASMYGGPQMGQAPDGFVNKFVS